MQRLVLRAYGGGLRFERNQMRPEFFKMGSMTHSAELRAMDLVELFHQLAMSRSEILLRRGELIGG